MMIAYRDRMMKPGSDRIVGLLQNPIAYEITNSPLMDLGGCFFTAIFCGMPIFLRYGLSPCGAAYLLAVRPSFSGTAYLSPGNMLLCR